MAKKPKAIKMAPKEVVALTPRQMIAEVRRLRAGGLFVGNMEFVDALLKAYDDFGMNAKKATDANMQSV